MSAPVRLVVAKIAARCNLDCDYCYEYHAGDESWRSAPRVMSVEVAEQLGRRIGEHARARGLDAVGVSLHGGEPLLVGLEHLRALVAALRRGAGARLALELGAQTNATLIDAAFARGLRELGIRVGVSLDGPGAANGHRLDHAGRPSVEAATRGLRHLIDAGVPLGGILAVIDLAHPPLETFEFLASFGPPQLDFLLPHGNWDRPPPALAGREAPYFEWLRPIFDAWFGGRHAHVDLRTFEEVIELLLGGAGGLETLGLGPVGLLSVGTGGTIEGVDTLKSVTPGAHALGLDVWRHTFDDALAHPMVAMRQHGLAALGDDCQACALVSVCGGGYLPHRYSSAHGYRARSVYCGDLAALIRHVARALEAVGALPAETRALLARPWSAPRPAAGAELVRLPSRRSA